MPAKNQVEVCFTPLNYPNFENLNAIVVVVNELRTTTSAMITAFMNGAVKIIPVVTLPMLLSIYGIRLMKNIVSYIEKVSHRKRLADTNSDNSIKYCHAFDKTNIILVLKENYLIDIHATKK